MDVVVNTPLLPESLLVWQPTFPPLPDWLETGNIVSSSDSTFVFPVGKPVGDDPTAYLRDVVLPHLAGLAERPSPELVFETAVLEEAATYLLPHQVEQYERRHGHLRDGTPVANAKPMQLRVHALATHGYAADGRRRPFPEWLEAARAALTTYRAPGEKAARLPGLIR